VEGIRESGVRACVPFGFVQHGAMDDDEVAWVARFKSVLSSMRLGWCLVTRGDGQRDHACAFVFSESYEPLGDRGGEV